MSFIFMFLVYMVAVAISTFSHSYKLDVLFSVLLLIPIWFAKSIYIHNKNKEMGNRLIKLKKTFSEEHGLRTILIISILVAIIIVVSTFFFSNSHRIGIPWLIVIAFAFIDQLYATRFLQNDLLENGICSGNLLIEWDRVQSYKWVIPRKKKDYSSIKIEYSKYYSFQIAYLSVLDDQKGEVDELFKKMTTVPYTEV